MLFSPIVPVLATIGVIVVITSCQSLLKASWLAYSGVSEGFVGTIRF